MSETSNRDKLQTATYLSAAILALPPIFAFLAAAFPGAVPIPFVDPADPAAARPMLLMVGVVLLVLNGGFLLFFRRFIEKAQK